VAVQHDECDRRVYKLTQDDLRCWLTLALDLGEDVLGLVRQFGQ
jgi:hypothetical protein